MFAFYCHSLNVEAHNFSFRTNFVAPERFDTSRVPQSSPAIQCSFCLCLQCAPFTGNALVMTKVLRIVMLNNVFTALSQTSLFCVQVQLRRRLCRNDLTVAVNMLTHRYREKNCNLQSSLMLGTESRLAVVSFDCIA